MFVCLLLNHAKTAERFCIKFGGEIEYNQEEHIGYFLSRKNVRFLWDGIDMTFHIYLMC